MSEAARAVWPKLAELIGMVELDEAANGGRIVTVAANASQLPVEDRDGRRVHPGRFGGWLVREATFDDEVLAAVIGLSSGKSLGLTVDGSVVEVVHG